MKDKKTQKHPVLEILFYAPAAPITALMIIPLTIIFYPIILLFKKHEIRIMYFSLYLQNACGLAGWLIIEEWLLSKIPLSIFATLFSISWVDILIALLIAGIVFRGHIKEMVNETLCKIYGQDWQNPIL